MLHNAKSLPCFICGKLIHGVLYGSRARCAVCPIDQSMAARIEARVIQEDIDTDRAPLLTWHEFSSQKLWELANKEKMMTNKDLQYALSKAPDDFPVEAVCTEWVCPVIDVQIDFEAKRVIIKAD